MASMSKKATCSLTREETERFINYYASHESLWNIASPSYSKREQRQAAYSSIAALMGNGMTADQVPTKISTLRTYYNKELRKESLSKRSGAGAEDLYISTWEWFPLLDPFLRSQVQQKGTITNLDQVESSEVQDLDPPSLFEDSVVVPTDTLDQALPQSLISNSPAPNKKPKKIDLQSEVLCTLRSIEKRRAEREDHGEALFGKYISQEIATIKDFRKRNELKLKIQQLIFEYQCEI